MNILTATEFDQIADEHGWATAASADQEIRTWATEAELKNQWRGAGGARRQALAVALQYRPCG